MLTGYKTYLTAALAFILAGAEMFGVLPNGVTLADPGALIMTGVGLIFARVGAVKQ